MIDSSYVRILVYMLLKSIESSLSVLVCEYFSQILYKFLGIFDI
jgi:Na+-translocating ferredoxin:NAD+ oxidoreductase RnfA subunit